MKRGTKNLAIFFALVVFQASALRAEIPCGGSAAACGIADIKTDEVMDTVPTPIYNYGAEAATNDRQLAAGRATTDSMNAFNTMKSYITPLANKGGMLLGSPNPIEVEAGLIILMERVQQLNMQIGEYKKAAGAAVAAKDYVTNGSEITDSYTFTPADPEADFIQALEFGNGIKAIRGRGFTAAEFVDRLKSAESEDDRNELRAMVGLRGKLTAENKNEAIRMADKFTQEITGGSPKRALASADVVPVAAPTAQTWGVLLKPDAIDLSTGESLTATSDLVAPSEQIFSRNPSEWKHRGAVNFASVREAFKRLYRGFKQPALSEQIQAVSTAYEGAGVRLMRRNDNIFQLAHRNFSDYRTWKKSTAGEENALAEKGL